MHENITYFTRHSLFHSIPHSFFLKTTTNMTNFGNYEKGWLYLRIFIILVYVLIFYLGFEANSIQPQSLFIESIFP